MAERLVQLAFQNGVLSPRALFSASSQDPQRRATLLSKGSRSARWRTLLGWNIRGTSVAGFNNRFPFIENGILRDARVAQANYATGPLAATALQTALNGALIYPNTTLSSVKPTLWLRASHRLRDWTATTESAPYSTWNSWDDAAHGVSESTNPPTWTAGYVNSLPAMIFDGTNDMFATSVNISALLGASGKHTTFVVCYCLASGGATQNLLTNATANWRLFYDESVSSFKFTINDGGTKTATKAGTQGAWHVLTVMQDGSNIYIGVDDADTAALASTAAGAPNNTGETLRVGGSGSNFFAGGIAEVLTYPVNLTEAERRKVHARLSTLYAITDNTTAPSWGNTYSVSYDADEALFTATRASGSDNWAPLAEADPLGAETAGDEACFADFGFLSNSYVTAASYTGNREARHGQEYVEIDQGEAACRVAISVGVNDTLPCRIGVSPATEATIESKIYTTPDDLADGVTAALVAALGAGISLAWAPTTSTLTITNATGQTVYLPFLTGANAGPEGTSAHRTLGWLDTDLTIANGGTATAPRQVWGWNPVSLGAVLDHNSGAGGSYTLILNDQSNAQANAARGPNAVSWLLRGDERMRVGLRGLYGESPVNLGRRYMMLVVRDCGNEDAFTELSVLYAGGSQALSRNVAAGGRHQYEPMSTTTRSDDGSHFTERRVPAHRYSGSWRNITRNDRLVLELLQLVCGMGTPFLFLEDPQSRAHVFDWTWYMVLDAPFEFTEITSDIFSTPVSFVEDLP